MRVFAYEYVTGGGLAGHPVSGRLVHQADLMARALLADLGEIDGVEVVTTRDSRLPPAQARARVLAPRLGESPRALFDRGVAGADAVWIIAPETGGVLEQLAIRARDKGRRLLGSTPEAIRIAASKSATAVTLAHAGLATPPTYEDPGSLQPHPGRWIVRPDDGAGCEDTVRVADWVAARAALTKARGKGIAQPWIEGLPASLSVIAASGSALLLCCNEQHIRVDEEMVMLAGLTVNAVLDPDQRLAALAQQVAAALPGLSGYFGIDLILSARGPVVLEVNPRLTTSYCGIRRALGVNVAAMVLDPRRSGSSTGAASASFLDLDLEVAVAD